MVSLRALLLRNLPHDLPEPPGSPLVEAWAIEATEARQGVFKAPRPTAIFAALLTACGEGVEPPPAFIHPEPPHGWRWVPLHDSVRPDFRALLEARGSSPEMVELGDEAVRQYFYLYRYWYAVFRRKSFWHNLAGEPVCPVTRDERLELDAWVQAHNYYDPRGEELRRKQQVHWFYR